MQLFISHSSKDARIAEDICERLERKGTKCFIAPRDIRSGKEYAEELVDGIDCSTAMLLLMSQEANSSPHVLREVERAVSKSIPILVYKLEEVTLSKSMEYFLMTHQWINAATDENYIDIFRFVDGLKEKNISEDAKSATEKNDETGKKPRSAFLLAIIALIAAVCCAAAVFLIVKGNGVKSNLSVGDTVVFGSYNGEDIEWRVLRLSEDGKQAVLVSARVLTMKAFDAAESGKYNWKDGVDYWSQDSEADTDMELQSFVRGNNAWEASNIRTWLNASGEVVTYTDQPPVASAMSELKNGYQNEAGFLHDFTEEELDAIVEVQNTTKGNVLSGEAEVITNDSVYLLSLDELQWFDEAGISKFAVPTQAAVEQDNSEWYLLDYNEFHINESAWWLREPVEDTASKCYLVGNGYTKELLRQGNAGLEGFGIRPAMTVDLRKADFFAKKN